MVWPMFQHVDFLQNSAQICIRSFQKGFCKLLLSLNAYEAPMDNIVSKLIKGDGNPNDDGVLY